MEMSIDENNHGITTHQSGDDIPQCDSESKTDNKYCMRDSDQFITINSASANNLNNVDEAEIINQPIEMNENREPVVNETEFDLVNQPIMYSQLTDEKTAVSRIEHAAIVNQQMDADSCESIVHNPNVITITLHETGTTGGFEIQECWND